MKDAIRQLIARGELREAIDLLRARAGGALAEQVTLLSFRAAELERKERDGTESDAVLGAGRAQLAQSVLRFLATLPEMNASSPAIEVRTPGEVTAREPRPLRVESPVATFIGYAHADAGRETWSALNELQAQLAPVRREKLIDIWSDHEIPYGRSWHTSIGAAIERSRLAILLVTPNYLASEYVAEHELPLILKRHDQGQLQLMPILVEQSDLRAVYRFEDANAIERSVALASLQFVNARDKPVASLSAAARQDVWLRVTDQIRLLTASRGSGDS